MDWLQVLSLILGNLAIILPLWLWNRAEARADERHLDAKIQSNRDLIVEIWKETKEIHTSIHNEMKDFHYRLLEIERSRKG